MNTKFNFIVDEFESESSPSYIDALQSLRDCAFVNVLIERLTNRQSVELSVPINSNDAASTFTHDFQLQSCDKQWEDPSAKSTICATCKKITFCGHSEKQICEIIQRFKKCVSQVTEFRNSSRFQEEDDPYIFKKKELLIFYELLTVNVDNIHSLNIWTLIREPLKSPQSNTTTKFQLMLSETPSKCSTCKYHSNLIPCDDSHCGGDLDIGDWSPIDDHVTKKYIFRRTQSTGKITFYSNMPPEILTRRDVLSRASGEHWKLYIPEHTVVSTGDSIKFETIAEANLINIHCNDATKRYELDVPIRSIEGGGHTNVKAETIIYSTYSTNNLNVINTEPTSGGNDGFSISQLLSLPIVNCDTCQNRNGNICTYILCKHSEYWSPKNMDVLKQVQEQLACMNAA